MMTEAIRQSFLDAKDVDEPNLGHVVANDRLHIFCIRLKEQRCGKIRQTENLTLSTSLV